MVVSTFRAVGSPTCLWNSKGREDPKCVKHLAEKKGQISPQINTARNRTSNALSHSRRSMPGPPLSLTEPCSLPPVGKGMDHLSWDECRKAFFSPQSRHLIKLSWTESVVLMLEFFVLSWSGSDFKLGGISYVCFCLYLLRTACSFDGLRRLKAWMCSHGLKEAEKIWFFLEYLFDHYSPNNNGFGTTVEIKNKYRAREILAVSKRTWLPTRHL